MTVRTHVNFIVLPHWETKLPAPWPDIPLSHIILTLADVKPHVYVYAGAYIVLDYAMT